MPKRVKRWFKSRFAKRTNPSGNSTPIDPSANHTTGTSLSHSEEEFRPLIQNHEPGTSLSHSVEQLRPVIQNLSAQLNLKSLFPVVRILVVGRSGSGKSTLIRLFTGNEGPVISDGTAGQQDIKKGWMIRDELLPFFSRVKMTGDEGPVMSDGTAGEEEIAKKWMIYMMGHAGPVMSDGTAGEQDIAEECMIHDDILPVSSTAGEQDYAEEWMNQDDLLPFSSTAGEQELMSHDNFPRMIMYDSNGIDLQAKERLEEIEKFLSNPSRKKEPIHLVWYIVNGTDNRFLDDNGLLRLIGRTKIPFVVVITHNDDEYQVNKNLTDVMLDRLLKDVENVESVKENIVRVGNNVKVLENGQVEMVKVDVEALKQLSRRTAELLNGPLKNTWIIQQEIDKEEKLKACARLILHFTIMGYFTAPLSQILIVFAPIEPLCTFWLITETFCRIWKAPGNFRIALRNTLLLPEIFPKVLETLTVALLGCAGLAVGLALTFTGTVLTFGAMGIPLAVSWLSAFAIVTATAGKSARGIFAVLILGCIMYVKPRCGCGENWDEQKSVEEYTVLCKAFAMSEHHEVVIEAVKKMGHVKKALIVNTKKQQDKLFQELVGTFEKMWT